MDTIDFNLLSLCSNCCIAHHIQSFMCVCVYCEMNQKWQVQKSHLICCDDHWQECWNVNKEIVCVCIDAYTHMHTLTQSHLRNCVITKHYLMNREFFCRIPPCLQNVSSFIHSQYASVHTVYGAKMYNRVE